MLHICVLLLYCCAYFKYLLYKTKIFLSVLYKIIQYLISPGLTWWYSGKESACSAGEPGSIPGLENSLEEKMSTHSSILAWEIPWTEEPGGLQFMGLQRVGHNGAWACFYFLTSLVAQMVKHLPTMQDTGFDPWVGKIPWRRKWQPTPVLLPGESHEHSPQGRKESDTTKRLHFHFYTISKKSKLKKEQ